MTEAFLCDAIRTPIGRYGGALAPVRADDLGAVPLKALVERNRDVDWAAVDDVIYGCANQAGEDNRNVARMSLLLAGLPHAVPGATINRLCGSGMDAIGLAARAIKAGEASLMIAGGVESMSRAPFVTGKATSAFSRQAEIFDTTIGWRFVNPLMKQRYGVDSMPETAENVATDYRVSRADQDAFALRSQQKAARAQADGTLAQEIAPVTIAQKQGEPLVVARDEHPRETTLEALAKLKGVVRPDGTVTAGNASGVNDGACALLVASEAAARRHGLVPRARQADGTLAQEIAPVTIAQKQGEPLVVARDEHPRETTLEALAKLKGVVRPDGTVTAGNASGVNDGACALLVASEAAARRHGLVPRARVLGIATAGVEPRVMGIGPAPATQKLLARLGMTLDQFDVIELNEAFASQGLAVLRLLGVADDDARVNPNGGAIALGHPLGASGARLVTTATYQLHRTGGRFALCTMCIGVGQGIAIAIERV
ncbi:beta-ketoadipyl CoA thiolase [Burkholderia pseudomallei]|nr:thiolase family protein [Burkholderia pseudomallei]CAK1333177.1 beta-ketoadipyl CoA thiolase [Burkholderia pseudomallei]